MQNLYKNISREYSQIEDGLRFSGSDLQKEHLSSAVNAILLVNKTVFIRRSKSDWWCINYATL